MKVRSRSVVMVMLGATSLLAACAANAPGAGGTGPMGFFVTSVGSGKGADLGGLAGADRHCQNLASAVGAGGRTWRAYLSSGGSFKAVVVSLLKSDSFIYRKRPGN